MDIDASNLHADHLGDCPRNLALDLSANIPNVDIVFHYDVKVNINCVVLDFNQNTFEHQLD